MINEDSPVEQVSKKFDELLDLLQLHKPNDRSNVDRSWAIVVTEVEKAKAVYLTYVYRIEGK